MHPRKYQNGSKDNKNVSRDNETQVWVNLYEKGLSYKRRKRSKFSVEHEQELQLIVEPKAHRIEKVFRKKMEGDRVLLYVKWKDYPDKFNSCVFQDEIESCFTLRHLATAVSIFTPIARFRLSKCTCQRHYK